MLTRKRKVELQGKVRMTENVGTVLSKLKVGVKHREALSWLSKETIRNKYVSELVIESGIQCKKYPEII